MQEYEQLLPDKLSEDDKMAVVLSVKDWKAIAENLHLDADCQSYGPAVTAWYAEEPGRPLPGPGYRKAYEHDAKNVACHGCSAATERCANTIEDTLERNGW